MIHEVKASSFADPADVAAFRRCKAKGGSDKQCFRVGDNGIGFWHDDTSQGSGPSCALPPETMVEEWGSVSMAHNQQVNVTYQDQSVTCFVRDTMPHLENITNGAGIDLNPDAVSALGLTPPIMVDATWEAA
jgi:hypothetical protein